MKITDKDAMLLDIQYIKPNRTAGTNDYLYIIWKDLKTGEKHLEAIPEPMMTIYFEKPEFRTHDHHTKYAYLDQCIPKTVKYKDIMYAIAEDIGEEGKAFLNNCFNTRNYKDLKRLGVYKYVFNNDIDIRTWYRYQWLKSHGESSLPRKLSKGWLDIEVDIMESNGLPSPTQCPIDLVTIIDNDGMQAYTFALIGVDCVPREYNKVLHPFKYKKEMERRKMYAHRMQEQEYYSTHIDEIKKAAHDMFDERYPGMEYNIYFYTDERKMLVHIWQLINKLKLDFIEIWNMPFDIPYIKERMEFLGLDPMEIMTSNDFPVKQCYFKKDTRNFDIKNKSDYFHLTSYIMFVDQMKIYAAIRKGGNELRSFKLDDIATKEVKDKKQDYSDYGNIKTLSYNNYLMYILYNIKDVLLQKAIENKVNDLDSYWFTSYQNITPYEGIYKMTVLLRCVQYKSFTEQGLAVGNNLNGYLYNQELDEIHDEDDDEEDKEDSKFEGAVVGNPKLIDNVGVELFGKKTNSIFFFNIDFDMSAFYPNTIQACNIDESTLFFKAIIDPSQYDVRGGKLKYNGITDTQVLESNKDSFSEDIAKEVFDNFQTNKIISFAHKWLNYPSISQIISVLNKIRR